LPVLRAKYSTVSAGDTRDQNDYPEPSYFPRPQNQDEPFGHPGVNPILFAHLLVPLPGEGASKVQTTILWGVAERPVAPMLVNFELIQDAQRGDPAAFNQIVSAYRRRILGTISRLIGRPEDVEDVAQEVFIRLFYSLEQLRTAEVFEPWLYRLTVNASYDYLRKNRRRHESRMADLSEQQVMMADAAAGSRAQSDDFERRRVRDTVADLLSSVSEEDRILLTLKEVEGLSLKELEQIYHVNENALKVRLFRARQRVLKNMKSVTESPARTAPTGEAE
jgi:RNA polymerase sigma-70 factor, ECF subfamily